LIDVRDGNRIAPIMKPMIGGLSEQDFKDIAAHFDSLKPTRLAE
jgi:cytochrome c553